MSNSLWPPWTVACQAPLSLGSLQARVLEWVAMPSSRGSSQPRNQTQVSHIAGGFFTIWITREVELSSNGCQPGSPGGPRSEVQREQQRFWGQWRDITAHDQPPGVWAFRCSSKIIKSKTRSRPGREYWNFNFGLLLLFPFFLLGKNQAHDSDGPNPSDLISTDSLERHVDGKQEGWLQVNPHINDS